MVLKLTGIFFCLTKNCWTLKYCGICIFWIKNICGPKRFGSKNMLGPKMLEFKKVLGKQDVVQNKLRIS